MGGIFGGGSSGGGDSDSTVRYARYIEDRHKVFLVDVYNNREWLRLNSPFSTYEEIDIDDAFLGVGNTMSTFPGLIDIWKYHMQANDITALYNSILSGTLNSFPTKEAIVAEGALMSEEVETHAIPRLMAGARDMNAVMSSTFVIAKGNIEASRIKQLSKFSASLKYNLLGHAMDRWKTHLEWHKSIVANQASIYQLYYASKLDTNRENYAMKAKNSLWPFTLLDYERAAIGALQGATNSKTVAGDDPSTARSTVGGAMSGAAMGAAVSGGNPVGAAIGGVVGGIAGFLF